MESNQIKICCWCGSRFRCLFNPYPVYPGSGMSKKSRSGFGMNIPDHISESFWVNSTNILWCGSGIRNLFDPGSGTRFGKILIQAPGLTSRIHNTANSDPTIYIITLYTSISNLQREKSKNNNILFTSAVLLSVVGCRVGGSGSEA